MSNLNPSLNGYQTASAQAYWPSANANLAEAEPLPSGAFRYRVDFVLETTRIATLQATEKAQRRPEVYENLYRDASERYFFYQDADRDGDDVLTRDELQLAVSRLTTRTAVAAIAGVAVQFPAVGATAAAAVETV